MCVRVICCAVALCCLDLLGYFQFRPMRWGYRGNKHVLSWLWRVQSRRGSSYSLSCCAAQRPFHPLVSGYKREETASRFEGVFLAVYFFFSLLGMCLEFLCSAMKHLMRSISVGIELSMREKKNCTISIILSQIKT